MSSVQTRSAHGRLVMKMLAVTLGMFAFGFALVPIYDVFCDITGLNGKTTGKVASASQFAPDPSRTVTVEFVASLNEGMPWEFRPVVSKMDVHPGEAYTAEFFTKNLSGRAMVGQAIPSVAPGRAARYFHKTECFCFRQQRFADGEARPLVLRFVVDPALPKDISTLSLSYTFFEIKG